MSHEPLRVGRHIGSTALQGAEGLTDPDAGTITDNRERKIPSGLQGLTHNKPLPLFYFIEERGKTIFLH